MHDNLLKINQVTERLNVTRQHIYKMMRNGLFPKPIKIGKRTVRWSTTEIGRMARGAFG